MRLPRGEAGIFLAAQNNIPVFSEGRFRAPPKYTMKGVPDIIVLKAGRFIGIEVKAPKGNLSPDQAEFGQEWRRLHRGAFDRRRTERGIMSFQKETACSPFLPRAPQG
jgi:hypothetical protein